MRTTYSYRRNLKWHNKTRRRFKRLLQGKLSPTGRKARWRKRKR